MVNINAVNGLVLSQEDAHQTHRTIRQIARETDIRHSSVVRIIRDELRLKCVKKRHAQELTEANCITRLSRAKKKLLSKFPESAVDFIFFTDEKVFTVAPPEPPERPCLRAVWDVEARHCRRPSASHSADVQQVCHGVCHGLKTWMY